MKPILGGLPPTNSELPPFDEGNPYVVNENPFKFFLTKKIIQN
jgi:hypothetical protein